MIDPLRDHEAALRGLPDSGIVTISVSRYRALIEEIKRLRGQLAGEQVRVVRLEIEEGDLKR